MSLFASKCGIHRYGEMSEFLYVRVLNIEQKMCSRVVAKNKKYYAVTVSGTRGRVLSRSFPLKTVSRSCS